MSEGHVSRIAKERPGKLTAGIRFLAEKKE
jgi:hypothetical protein